MLAVVGVIAGQRNHDRPTITTEVPAQTASVPTTITPPSYTVFLTGSAEEAIALEQNLALMTPATGEPILGQVLTLAAGSTEDRAYAQYLITALEDQTNGRGVQIVDVRPPTATMQPGRGAGGCEGSVNAGDASDTAC